MKNINAKGFTLIESLISIIILAIILIGGMTFYFNSDRVLTLSSHKKLAIELAHDELEELKTGPYAAVVSSGPTIISVGNLGNQTIEVIVDFEDDPIGGVTAEDYKNVEVKVTWSEAGQTGSREISMSTFIAP